MGVHIKIQFIPKKCGNISDITRYYRIFAFSSRLAVTLPFSAALLPSVYSEIIVISLYLHVF